MDYQIKTLEQLRPILVGLRKQAGLSQAALAALLGVSQQSYAKIELHPPTTSVERLFKIVSLLGGNLILSDRMPAEPSASSLKRASEAPGNNSKKASPAPAKLIPPSKETESW
ncbi:helix-turn-helix domain-containing protein [Massilia sp. TSP1-1-2]|uniref:helix-turn-helix domain-containing protein n=1 Tax=unclassified Massilia TaxID=2609279 RepID=UPI003CF08AE7